METQIVLILLSLRKVTHLLSCFKVRMFVCFKARICSVFTMLGKRVAIDFLSETDFEKNLFFKGRENFGIIFLSCHTRIQPSQPFFLFRIPAHLTLRPKIQLEKLHGICMTRVRGGVAEFLIKKRDREEAFGVLRV